MEGSQSELQSPSKVIDDLIKNIEINIDDLKTAVLQLKQKDIDSLLGYFSDYSSKEKNQNQIWEDLRRLAILNLAALKGYYANYYFQTHNEIIYNIKNRVIKQVILNPKGIKIKTDKEKNSDNIPGILYFEHNGHQISFHIPHLTNKYNFPSNSTKKDILLFLKDSKVAELFRSEKSDENTLFVEDVIKLRDEQDDTGKWNEKPGDYLTDDYSKILKLAKIDKAVQEYRIMGNNWVENKTHEFYLIESEIKTKLKAIGIYDPTYSTLHRKQEITIPDVLGGSGKQPLDYFPFISEYYENRMKELQQKKATHKMIEYEQKMKDAKTKKTRDKYLALYEEEKNTILLQLNENNAKEQKLITEYVNDIKAFVLKYIIPTNPFERFNPSTIYCREQPDYQEWLNNQERIQVLEEERDNIIQELVSSPEYMQLISPIPHS